jgi:hypothetical protein
LIVVVFGDVPGNSCCSLPEPRNLQNWDHSSTRIAMMSNGLWGKQHQIVP